MKRFLIKATEYESGRPRRSHNWIFARRGWFKVFEDRIECGDWAIPFRVIDKAVLYTVRSFPVPASVLELHTAGKTYQFGFNPWAHPEEHLPLEIERQSVRFGHSVFGFIVRVALSGYLLWRAWLWWIG